MAGPLGVLLAPGAGTDRNHSSLVTLADALTGVGHDVVRMDFPYRKAGKKVPDKTPVLVQAVRDEANSISTPLVLGGRSMGGRMCSIAVAEGLEAAALILICYPLHPPGKPDRLRVEHFPNITIPCLFVSGTRDAFGTPDELQSHTTAIAGPVTHVWIEGADHSLRKRDGEVAGVVVEWLSGLRTLPATRATGSHPPAPGPPSPGSAPRSTARRSAGRSRPT